MLMKNMGKIMIGLQAEDAPITEGMQSCMLSEDQCSEKISVDVPHLHMMCAHHCFTASACCGKKL